MKTSAKKQLVLFEEKLKEIAPEFTSNVNDDDSDDSLVYLCDIADTKTKSDILSIDVPLFSLDKKIQYDVSKVNRNGVEWTIYPTKGEDDVNFGRPTIYDRDILVYITSKLIAGQNRGDEINKKIEVNVADLLKVIGRSDSKDAYVALEASLKRLTRTYIKRSDIVIYDGESQVTDTSSQEVGQPFIADVWKQVQEKHCDNARRIQVLHIKVSDWLWQAVRQCRVLSMSKKYFELSRPVEKRLYEIARKYVGNECDSKKMNLDDLYERFGTRTSTKAFKSYIKNIAKENAEKKNFPDFDIFLEGDFVIFKKRVEKTGFIRIEEGMKETVKEMCSAAGLDYNACESDFYIWAAEREKITNTDQLFLSFASTWIKNRTK